LEYKSKVIFAVVAALIFSMAGVVKMVEDAPINDGDDEAGLDFPATGPSEGDDIVTAPFDHTGMYVSIDKYSAEDLMISGSLLEGWTNITYDNSLDSKIQATYEKDGVQVGIGIFFYGDVPSSTEEFMNARNVVLHAKGFQDLDLCEHSYKIYATSDLGETWGYAVQDLNMIVSVAIAGANDMDYQDLIYGILNEISKNIHDAAELFEVK